MSDYVEAIRGRYRKSERVEKGKILNEFVKVPGYHLKSVIRLLRGIAEVEGPERRGRRRTYGAQVREALERVREAADRICGKRLRPFLPELVRKLSEWEELKVSEMQVRIVPLTFKQAQVMKNKTGCQQFTLGEFDSTPNLDTQTSLPLVSLRRAQTSGWRSCNRRINARILMSKITSNSSRWSNHEQVTNGLA